MCGEVGKRVRRVVGRGEKRDGEGCGVVRRVAESGLERDGAGCGVGWSRVRSRGERGEEKGGKW